MTIHDFQVGDSVIFGRHNGEQTRGTVTAKGRTKLKVKQMESRGAMKSHPVGTIWTVPPSMCRKANGSAATAPAPVATPAFRVGQPVEFEGFNWSTRSTGQVKGVVTQVGPQGVEVYGPQGSRFLQATQVKAATKRTDAAVMDDIKGVYCGLSPECLTCDGELPRNQVARRSAELRRALKALFVELGREVTESESYGDKPYTGETTPVSRGRSTYAPAKASGFKVGDKVSFTSKGETLVGVVLRVSAKTVSVSPDGRATSYWRVPPHMLRAV